RPKILGKTAENRGQSESSPRCLNAVNPAVVLSALKNQLPEKTCGKRTRWLTGAPVNQRVGLFRSPNVGPIKVACLPDLAPAPAGSWETTPLPQPALGGLLGTALVLGCGATRASAGAVPPSPLFASVVGADAGESGPVRAPSAVRTAALPEYRGP